MNQELKSAFQQRRRSLGGWLMLGHTAIAEIMAQAGFDWIAIDLEHSVIGIDMVQPLIQVIDLSGCSPLVRLTENDTALIKRVMDAGAHGVIVPMVSSALEAEAAVAAVKYPPRGIRGVGLARAQGYGAGFEEYFRSANDRSIVIVQIEHRDAVDAVEEIAATSGVDGLMIGPYDLSCSLGIPGDFANPLMKAAEMRVLDAAEACGISVGMHVVTPSPKPVAAYFQRGFTFAAYGADMLFLTWSSRSSVAALRALPADS